jgi:hypothetical protein
MKIGRLRIEWAQYKSPRWCWGWICRFETLDRKSYNIRIGRLFIGYGAPTGAELIEGEKKSC